MDFPENFNWVKEHDKCSLHGAFLTLREMIDNDVKTMNQLHPEAEVALEDFGPSKFLVRKKHAPQAAVFEINGKTNAIDVRHGPTVVILSAKPEICPDGECRLKVDNEYLRFWQVSQRALESLWF